METYKVVLADGETLNARSWADVLWYVHHHDVERVAVSVNGTLAYHINVNAKPKPPVKLVVEAWDNAHGWHKVTNA